MVRSFVAYGRSSFVHTAVRRTFVHGGRPCAIQFALYSFYADCPHHGKEEHAT